MNGRVTFIAAIAGTIAFSVGMMFLRARSAVKPNSGVVFESSEIRLGDVRQGEAFEPDVMLVNRLEWPIKILAVHASCTCTTVPTDVVGRELRPLESMKFPVTYNSGSGDGKSTGSISVLYEINDRTKTRMSAVLQISAVVLPDFRVSPEFIEFGDMTPGAPAQRTVHLTPVGFSESRIIRARSSHQEFEPGEIFPVDGHDGCGLTIRFLPPVEPATKTFSGVLYLDTTSPRVPTARVYLKARYHPPVEIAPSSVVFSSASGSENVERLLVTSRHPCRDVKAKARGDGIGVTVSRRDAHTHELVVSLSPDYKSTEIHSVVDVEIVLDLDGDQSGFHRVSIPVHKLTASGVKR